MQTIGAILGREDRGNSRAVDALPSTTKIGIELELEGGHFEETPAGWDRHQDGSLRDGREFVFNGPMGGQDALNAILAMGEACRVGRPRPTFRCSTHIHMDVRDLDPMEVLKVAATFVIMEDVMFDHCQEYRRFSNFCTPFFMSDGLIHKIIQAKDQLNRDRQAEGLFVHVLRNYPKYSGFNMQPITSYGSVEFRGSHAMTNSEDLLHLAQRMLHIKRVATAGGKDQTLEDLIRQVNGMTPAQVFPTGLREGYQRDGGLADHCYSNALLLLQPQRAPQVQREPQQFGGGFDWGEEGVAAPRPHPRAQAQNGWAQVATLNVLVKPEGFTRLGIHARQGTSTLQDVYNTLCGFKGIRGIQQPNPIDLWDFRLLALTQDQWNAMIQKFQAARLNTTFLP